MKSSKGTIAVLLIIIVVLSLILADKFISSTNPEENYWDVADIEIADDFDTSNLEEELSYIPQVIVQRFNDRHWSIKLDQARIDEYNKTSLTSNAIGVSKIQLLQIWASDSSVIIHEMGHFYHLEISVKYGDRIIDCFQKEGDTVIYEGETGYSAMNEIEYFACFFEFYLKNLDNKEVMEGLKERKPETFEMFEELRANDWYIRGDRLSRFIVQQTQYSLISSEIEKYFGKDAYIQSMKEFYSN